MIPLIPLIIAGGLVAVLLSIGDDKETGFKSTAPSAGVTTPPAPLKKKVGRKKKDVGTVKSDSDKTSPV